MDADGKLVIKIYKNGDTDTVTDESDEVTAAEQGNAIESAAEDFTITTVQDGQNPEKKAGYRGSGKFRLQARLNVGPKSIATYIRR